MKSFKAGYDAGIGPTGMLILGTVHFTPGLCPAEVEEALRGHGIAVKRAAIYQHLARFYARKLVTQSYKQFGEGRLQVPAYSTTPEGASIASKLTPFP